MKQLTHRSLRLKLDDIISPVKFESQVLENIRYCRKVCGKTFKVIFWYDGLTESNIKDFIRRNEKLLCDVNSEITKGHTTDAWFIIDAMGEENDWRYKWDGNILEGISEYIKLIKHINKKETE
jgi:hypothetical protein